MMSMSRNAWVTQITAVRLIRTSANAPNVVRKMYRLMEPMACSRSPYRSKSLATGTTVTSRAKANPSPPVNLVQCTKWLPQGKAIDHAKQMVNGATFPDERKQAFRGRFWQEHKGVFAGRSGPDRGL